MGQTMLDRDTADTGRLASPGQAGGGVEGGTSSPGVTGWLWTWVILGIIVVVVVIAFLLGIVSALTSIDSALAEADDAVSSIHGNVQGEGADPANLPEGVEPIENPQPLPANVENINSNLSSIDGELAAIPGQADQIISALSTISGTLDSVDSSLAGTSSTLQGTDSSLADTSGMLQETLGIAESIRVTLEDVQAAEGQGTEDIWPRVDVANNVLTEANSDTGNILGELEQTDLHLESVCRTLLGPC